MNRSTIVLGREEPGTQETHKVGPPVPPAHEVQEQVEHILGSDEFLLPQRGRNFLHFVVSETLAGRRG